MTQSLAHPQAANSAEARLLNRLMLLMSKTNEPMAMGDALGNLLDVNQAMCGLMNSTRERLLQMRVPDFMVGGENQALRNRELRKASGTLDGEIDVRRPDGSEFRARFWDVEVQLEGGVARNFIGLSADATALDSQETNAILRTHFDDSPDGKLIVDSNGRTIYANQNHRDIWGLSVSDLDASFPERRKKTYLRMPDPEPFKGMFRTIDKDPKAYVECTVVLVGGQTMEVRSVPLVAKSGSVLGRSFSTRDVTAHAHAEATLRENASLLAALSAHSPAGVVAVDLAGNLLYCSQRFLEIWGFEDGWQQLSSREQARAYRKRFRDEADYWAAQERMTSQGPVESLEEFALVDGKTVATHVVPMFDEAGTPVGRAVFYRDVTEERKAEATLKESEIRYRTLVSSLPVGVVLHYADNRIGATNEAAERILGMTDDELLGLSAFDPRWKPIWEDGTPVAPHEQPSAFTMATGEPCSDVVIGMSHVTGGIRWMLVNSVALRDAEEAIYGTVVSFQDITEQRQAQAALLQTRTAEAFNALASGVAHKVNNSLATIVGNAYIAGLPANVPAETTESLAEVMAAATDAAALVRDLLALSGGARTVPQPVDVSRGVRQTVAHLGNEETSRISLALDYSLEAAVFDARALEQVTTIFLRNALEAGTNVTLATRTEVRTQNPVGITCSSGSAGPGTYVAVEVGDDGPGLDPGIVARIFQPFASTKFAGRGLGLAAAAGIAGSYRSVIEIESSATGCVARLLIPIG